MGVRMLAALAVAAVKAKAKSIYGPIKLSCRKLIFSKVCVAIAPVRTNAPQTDQSGESFFLTGPKRCSQVR